ncbi:MAG: HPP family protein [Ardenticatenaceae bacterium]
MTAKLVVDIMQIDPITAHPDDPLGVAGRRLLESGQNSLPVVDQKRHICGMLAERDLRLAADSPLLEETAAEIFDNLQNHKVREVMTTAVRTIESDAPIIEAAQVMRVAGVGELPVVQYDESGNHERLIGMITHFHLLDFLILLLQQDEPDFSDSEAENE